MQSTPDLSAAGALHFPSAFGPVETAALAGLLSLPGHRPGGRLGTTPALAALLRPADRIAASLLGPGARAVGAKLFDKSPFRNWSLGWHQDRTIPVRERLKVPASASGR